MRATMRGALALLVIPFAATDGVMTCGDLKDFYKSESCCGQPAKPLSKEPGPACPYNFNKPACAVAEPQAPRDLSSSGSGHMTPKAATLNHAQAQMLPLSNTHFHLGAEHKSDHYMDDTDTLNFDAHRRTRRLATDARPGYMCSNANLNATQLMDYTFSYCKGAMHVGKSYEVHYVHSSAGYSEADLEDNQDLDLMNDGLGGAANGRGLLNPMVVVEAQVFHIVQGAQWYSDLLHGWSVFDHSNAVMYAGSTTGPSHNNEVCSPYAVTWHVDKNCHEVSPEAFDNLCKMMKDAYNLDGDLYPHGSREIVAAEFVVNDTFVHKYE